MNTVLLLIHVMVAIALVGVVLLQRSEGGALGIGGAGRAFIARRRDRNAMTKTTLILAACCFDLLDHLVGRRARLSPAPTILPAGEGGANGLAPLQIPGAPAPAAPSAPAAPQAPQSQ